MELTEDTVCPGVLVMCVAPQPRGVMAEPGGVRHEDRVWAAGFICAVGQEVLISAAS